MKSFSRLLLLALPLALAGRVWAAPVSYAVDPENSVFAVVTHKGGIAASMAHNHLIIAKTYTCEIQNSTGSMDGLSFSLTFPVTELAPDIPEAQKKWFPEIKKLGILVDPFSAVSESDRATIQEHMLAEDQLDAGQFPEIKAELVSIQSISATPSIKSTAGEKTFAHAATIRFTVHGKTVERAVPANVRIEDGALNVEAIGRFRFTEFGFDPYSAFFGAVKNQDEFDVYVRIQANERKETTQAER